MMRCKEVQQWIERYMDGEEELPLEAREHILRCEACYEYQTLLEEVSETLRTMEIPSPDPALVDDVMRYIATREQERSSRFFIPGLTLLTSLWSTVKHYAGRLSVPQVIRKEAWAFSFATVVVLWSALISPQVQSGKMEALLTSPVMVEMDRIAIALRDKGVSLVNDIFTFTIELFGGETGASDAAGQSNSNHTETPQQNQSTN